MMNSRQRILRHCCYSFILSILCISLICPPGMTQQPAKSVAELESLLAQNPNDANSNYELGLILALKGEVESGLTHLETATRVEPDNLKYGNAYRMMSIKHEQFDRDIKFLEKLVKDMEKADQDFPALRVNLALAYVDKMPAEDIGIVTQARLSTKSIRLLKKVLAKQPDSWPGAFALGMNHLYWPRAMRHLGRSIEGFEKCIAIQEAMTKETGKLEFYFVRAYLGLGDAYAKGKKYDEAREIWRQADALFPDNPRLRQRLDLTDDKSLGKFIGKERGLGAVVNTDLTILWSSESVYRDVFGEGIAYFLR